MLDLSALRRANPMPDIVAKMVALRSVGSEFVACCPFHADRSPSFTLFRGNAGDWQAHCFGCGWHGDVLDFVQKAYSVSLPEAARLLGGGEVPARELQALPAVEQASRIGEALAIWNRAKPAAGTLAEAYLRFRGIAPPYPPDIRFLRLPCGNSGSLPCMVAAVRDVAGEITGVQRIWLANDGKGKADLAKPKLSLGQVKGGAIRLGDLDGKGCLTVCEGPEDGLSLLQMLGGPVWVAAGATFLPAMAFPPDVRAIIIGADNDPAGNAAARKAAQTYTVRGLPVRIIRPLDWAKDFNDELKGVRRHAT